MKRHSLSRRSFIKKSSVGLAGAALTTCLSGTLYGNVIKKADALAILGGKPVRENSYKPAGWPISDETDEKALMDVLKGGNWSEFNKAPTELTVQYEEKFAKVNNVPYAFMTNGGQTRYSYLCKHSRWVPVTKLLLQQLHSLRL